MLKILRQRNFSFLWIGQFISVIGDYVLFIALPFYTYNLTGSVLATSAMFFVSTLPRMFLGSVAGVFVDRWDRKRTMIIADLLRILLVGMLVLVRSSSWLWLIYASAFLESVVSQFFNPAKSAIIPLLVDEKDLMPANSLNGLSDALTRLLGSALGGVLMGWLGFSSVVLLDAGTFLFSAVMIGLIIMPGRTVRSEESDPPSTRGWQGMWQELVGGLKLVRQNRLLFLLFIVLGVAFLGDSMITVLIVPLVKDLIGGGAQLLGWMMTAQGIGGLVGGILVGKIGNRIPARRLAAFGLAATGIVVIAIVIFPRAVFVLPIMGLGGVFVSAWLISSETMLQLAVSDSFRGRIFGTLGTVSALANLVGMLFAGASSDFLGVVFIMCVAGGLYAVSGILGWVMLPEQKLLQQDHPDQPEVALIPSQAPGD
jgi:MFS family permease